MPNINTTVNYDNLVNGDILVLTAKRGTVISREFRNSDKVQQLTTVLEGCQRRGLYETPDKSGKNLCVFTTDGYKQNQDYWWFTIDDWDIEVLVPVKK